VLLLVVPAWALRLNGSFMGLEDQVQYQASPFVRGNADCDNCRVEGRAVPTHAMQAYRMERRYSSTHS